MGYMNKVGSLLWVSLYSLRRETCVKNKWLQHVVETGTGNHEGTSCILEFRQVCGTEESVNKDFSSTLS